eukprot:jgi/Ulvmu1/2387/UM130_0020.1
MLSFFFTNVLCTIAGLGFPGYMTFRALETYDPADEKQWLTYWVIFAILQSIEVFGYYILTWIPLYYELKLILIIWLINPGTRGAEVLYNKYIWKLLRQYASQWDPTFKPTNGVPPELHREMFINAKKHAERFGVPALQDMFKEGFDFKGVAGSLFGKKT